MLVVEFQVEFVVSCCFWFVPQKESPVLFVLLERNLRLSWSFHRDRKSSDDEGCAGVDRNLVRQSASTLSQSFARDFDLLSLRLRDIVTSCNFACEWRAFDFGIRVSDIDFVRSGQLGHPLTRHDEVT